MQTLEKPKVIPLMEFLNQRQYLKYTDEELQDIENKKQIKIMTGRALVTYAANLGYTTKATQFSLHAGIAYVLDIKLKVMLPMIERYMLALRDYLEVAQYLNTLEGWYCSVELAMLDGEIENDMVEQYVNVIKDGWKE